jgi:hypothetical protein
VSKKLPPVLAMLAVSVWSLAALAIEPDGRVALRYAWPDRKADAASPRLQVSVTAVTPLKDARLVARVPSGLSIALRDGVATESWPAEGLVIGDLAAGKTVVLELDVPKPARGGGIVGFYLEATADGKEIREGVGVPVGTPGTQPTIRNDAAEFPAATPETGK